MRFAKTAAVLLAASAGASMAQPDDWSGAQTVTIAMSNFKFTPPTVTLEHGTPYRLHLVNNAAGGHDFVAKGLFANSTIAPEDRDKLKDGSLDLAGGESADIRLIPNQPGSYKTHCSHFMHSAFGMTGLVTVR